MLKVLFLCLPHHMAGSRVPSTLMLQKSGMLQIQGIEGEAVVTYREPSITKELRYYRLSRVLKNMKNSLDSWNSPSVDP